MIVAVAIAFLAALLASLLLTPVVRGVALRIGLTDRPDSHRKLHGHPIPLGGGVAVFLATSVVIGVVLLVPNPWNIELEEEWFDVLSFVGACLAVVILGLIDDCFGLRGRHKLLGQVGVASILIASGLIIQRFTLFGWQCDLGWLAIPFTVFWLVGAMNSVNLLDGIDGLATVLGIVLSGTICILALRGGHPAVAVVALVFTGSLLGFLRYNFPPASIFLGDAGSMLIGLMVGALAIRGSLKGPGTVLLAAPLAICTLPILDSAAAIIRRKLTGRSIYATDRSHLHHRLLNALGSNRRVLAVVAVCCLATSAASVASICFRSDLIALVTCSAVVLMMVATGLFGRGEWLLLSGRVRHAASSLLHPVRGKERNGHQTVVRLQGSRRWDLLWEALVESTDKLGLNEMGLDVNLPAAKEEYNASWSRSLNIEYDRCWRIEIPLIVGNVRVGHLRVVGQHRGEPALHEMQQVLDLLEPFESQLLALTTPGNSVPDRKPSHTAAHAKDGRNPVRSTS